MSVFVEPTLLSAKTGDIIEFQRHGYSHYALYLGNNTVMNPNAERDNKIIETVVKVKSLVQVAKSSLVRVRNHDEVALRFFGAQVRSVDQILQAAEADVGKDLPYKVLGENCEYYATKWRYGKGFSTQAIWYWDTTAGDFLSRAGRTLFSLQSTKEEADKFGDEVRDDHVTDMIELYKSLHGCDQRAGKDLSASTRSYNHSLTIEYNNIEF